MKSKPLHITIIGLSITSSWGNGHATTYRALVRELHRLGHQVTFYEQDVPYYAGNRDLAEPPFCRTVLYDNYEQLIKDHRSGICGADFAILGSYVKDGVAIGQFITREAEGVTAFYDIDTPVTLAKLRKGDYEYLHPDLIPRFDVYLSFNGGPTLEKLEEKYGAPRARPLHCSVDTELYYPEEHPLQYDLGYLGTYSTDRQPPLERLMLDAARRWDKGRFIVAGPQYPEKIDWPSNTKRVQHLPPAKHRHFYNSQRFTLNLTRADMIEAGYSPSVRIFEAGACGVPIISDYWDGLETFLVPGEEILISKGPDDTLEYLTSISEEERRAIGENGRKKILKNHTSRHRAQELVSYYQEIIGNKSLLK